MKKKELLTMKELPESERPYEKAEKEGRRQWCPFAAFSGPKSAKTVY